MAIHYEVPEGQSLTIAGPANVIVKAGDVPHISEMPASDKQHVEPAAHATKAKSK